MRQCLSAKVDTHTILYNEVSFVDDGILSSIVSAHFAACPIARKRQEASRVTIEFSLNVFAWVIEQNRVQTFDEENYS